MKKLLSALCLLLAIIFFSCKTGGKSSKKDISFDWPRRAFANDTTPVPRISAIGTNKDSTRFSDYFFCLIQDGVGYDSVHRKKFITTDTQWWVPVYVRDTVRDAQTKKPKLDSAGKLQYETLIRAAPFPKDSVRWKDIFGKTYAELFDKKAPTH